MSDSFDLEAPDHFTAGAVGPPGQRVFYLQAREAGALLTLKCEKEHVRALGDYLAGLLERLAAAAPSPGAAPALLEPVQPAWDVGAIGVGYDDDGRRIVIEMHEAAEAEEEADGDDAESEEAETPTLEAEPAPAPVPEGAVARIRITHEQAAAFVERARELMRGGRPLCPMCQSPIDPGGHVCPRANGHVATRG
jgi:uncharacterized repeat protein (TIGR03847 family)